MADALNRTTKELRRFINTPDIQSADWIIGPDLSAVLPFPSKYWPISGDTVSLMDQAARDAVDVAEAQGKLDADRSAQKDRLDTEMALKALALVVMDEINILRTQHGLPTRTGAQLVGAIKSKIDEV